METQRGNHDGSSYEAYGTQQTVQETTVSPYHERMEVRGDLDPSRLQIMQQTYLYLAVAVFAAMVGGYLGMRSTLVISMLTSGIVGWIGIMVLLNVTPWLALYVANNHPRLAVPGLALDGFIGGIALSPLLLVAAILSKADTGPSLIHSALVVTGTIFGAVTFYIYTAKKTFSFGKGLMFGLFSLACIAIPVNMVFLQLPLLSNLIVGVVGVLGLLGLLHSTSTVLHDPAFDNPTLGALMLFSALFNIFQTILYLFIGGARD